MNWFAELRERRVFPFTISYIVGAFGLVQFLEFLEGRLSLSPHLVNLVGLALVLLLPSVIVLAWSLGRPGDDTLGRAQKVAIPANVLAAGVLLFFVFQGKELGAVTRTIEVADEHGTVTERVVPKSAFRKRVLFYYPESSLADRDEWIRETAGLMLVADLSQDIFLDVGLPLSMPNAMRDAGHPDAHDIPRPLMRKIATDGHFAYYGTGSIEREGETWVVTLEIFDAGTGRGLGEHVYRDANLADLVDRASIELRRDLGVPPSHIESAVDLPVAELTSENLDAVREHTAAAILVTHHNDWAGAAPHLEKAVELDPQYALAQFMSFAVYQTLGEPQKSAQAMDAAMANLYRVTERTSFLIKSQYYLNIEQDMEKALAVLEMWSRLYPNDTDAYAQLALFRFVRQDLAGTVEAYEKILEIDPSQYQYLEEIADLQRQLGQIDAAEATLKRYIARFPARSEGYRDLAEFYIDVGRLEEARSALDEALLIDPADPTLKMRMVTVDLRQGRYEEVEAELERAALRDNTPRQRARLHSQYLALAAARGRPDLAAVALDSFYAAMAVVQNPLQLDIAYSLMLPTLSMLGRPQQALDEVNAASARIPEPFAGLAGMGRAWALADLGRPAEAREQLAIAQKVVDTYQFETFRSSLALVGGMIDEAEGDLDTSIEQYRQAGERALQNDPNIPLRLAGALRRRGDLKEAREAIDQALAFHPAHPEAHLELARIELARGQRQSALEHLEVATSAWKNASPDYEPAREAERLLTQLQQAQ